MKKTTCIQLVLITAALAGCDRPLYQQEPDYAGGYDRGPYYPGNGGSGSPYDVQRSPYGTPGNPYDAPRGDAPDSSNSCPMAQSQLPPDYYLWYSGLQPYNFYYGDGFNLDGYYLWRYPATIVRAGFGHIGYFRIGAPGHS